MAPNSFSSFDDVPEAQRDNQPKGARSPLSAKSRRWLLWFGVGLLSAVLGLAISWATYSPSSPRAIAFIPATDGFTTPAASPGAPAENTLLGHRAYEEAAVEDLVALPSAPNIRLRPAAVEALEVMLADARAAGIDLLPLSGFRSVEDQNYLFFNVKAERGEAPTQRAEVSAPPGYSEHHTGYAVDLGDANVATSHVEETFEDTEAFAWLQANASRYSFELSFPRDNPQNIQYEPWHWRFVGDADSLETFYQDR